MKKMCLLTVGLLVGCASVDKIIDPIHPAEYGMSEELDGKMFTISCAGNTKADSRFVDNECKKSISEFAYVRGYSFFTVLDSDSQENVQTNSYTVNEPLTTESESSIHDGDRAVHKSGATTTYVPKTKTYTVTTYSQEYTFVLIDKSEKAKYKNYYKVSDYYTPDKK